MNKIELIKKAIQDGVNHKSKLTAEQFKVGGFTSPAIRHIMNNLGAISTNYFEVGSHIGCSLIMTTYGNDNLKTATACDNFSEFQNGGRTKQQFLDNCEANISGRYKLLEKNCYKITKDELPEGIDLYLFDGAHDKESQREGVMHFAPMMADEFILMVDDTSWQAPRLGTAEGIKESGLTILYETFLFDGIEGGQFWNGFSIFLLKK
jgi:folylpolyglutamate synthase/dihydropteroate synthase